MAIDTAYIRVRLRQRDGDKCTLCRQVMLFVGYPDSGRLMPNHATIDHKVPRAKGGSNKLSNLQLMCYSCNHFKGDCYGI